MPRKKEYTWITPVPSSDGGKFFVLRKIVIICGNPARAMNSFSDNDAVQTCIDRSSDILVNYCNEHSADELYTQKGKFKEDYKKLIKDELLGDANDLTDSIYEETGCYIKSDSLVDIIPANDESMDNVEKKMVNEKKVADSIADLQVQLNEAKALEAKNLASGVFKVEYKTDKKGRKKKVGIKQLVNPNKQAEAEAVKAFAKNQSIRYFNANFSGSGKDSSAPNIAFNDDDNHSKNKQKNNKH